MKLIPRKDNSMRQSNQEIVNVFEEEKVPKVNIDSYELTKVIGEWLENVFVKEEINGQEVLINTMINKLMREKSRKGQEKAICYTFGLVLLDMGIAKDEVISLTDFDKENYTFKCHLKGENKTLDCALRLGDAIDNLPVLIVKYDNGERRYEYCPASEYRALSLTLVSYVFESPDSGNTLYNYMSPYDINFKLQNGNIGLTIDISINGKNSLDNYDPSFYLKRGSAELSQYLLGLGFPISLDDVYKNMLKFMPYIIENCQNFIIICEKNLEDDKKEVSDELFIKNGELLKFIMTKDGKRVGLDKEGNTTYQDGLVCVNNNKDGSIEYGLKVVSVKELAHVKSVEESVNLASLEVEEIRKLAKTLLNKDI